MCPLAQPDGHDGPRLIDKSVPCITAVVEYVLVGLEDTVREPVVAHELPDVFDRVEFGALGRQRDDGDVLRDDKPMRQVPSRLVDEKHGMRPWCDGLSNPRRPRATPGAATVDLVLLPDPGFVSEPDLYRGRLDALLLRDLCHDGRETF